MNRPGTIHLSSEIAERFERTAEETAADCRNKGGQVYPKLNEALNERVFLEG